MYCAGLKKYVKNIRLSVDIFDLLFVAKDILLYISHNRFCYEIKEEKII